MSCNNCKKHQLKTNLYLVRQCKREPRGHMRFIPQIGVKAAAALLSLAFLTAACQGHYNPRAHIDETPAAPGQVKTKYYH